MSDAADDATGLYGGRLLVATPDLEDPNFDRTVVLLLEHGPDGALGVVLNRPSDLLVVDHLPAWAPVAPEPAVVFLGGPVARSAVLGLGHTAAADGEAGTPLAVDLDTEPELLARSFEAVRIFAGYAGWAAHQLEAEIIAGGWFVVDAKPSDAFSANPGDLWWDVLGRQSGPLARLANFPLDPSMN